MQTRRREILRTQCNVINGRARRQTLIITCLCFVSFQYAYLSSTLRARSAESTIANSSAWLTLMDNYGISEIDYPEVEDSANRNSPVEDYEPVKGTTIEQPSPEVDVHKIKIGSDKSMHRIEIETSQPVSNAKPYIIKAEDPASSPKATIAYGT